MSSTRAAWVTSLLVAGTLAGCVDAPTSAAVRSSAPLPAAEPVVALDTGSITGVVVSDEELPIPAARVVILETKNATETDDAGKFTFNGLQPATYGVLVESLGFASASRRVLVKAGEVSEQRFVLEPVSFAEPYVDLRRHNAYILFGQTFADIGTHEVTEELCKPCHFYARITPQPVGGVIEVDWTPPVHVAPILNDDVFVLLCKNPLNGTTRYRCGDSGQQGTAVKSGNLKVRGKLDLDGAILKDAVLTRLDIHAGLSVAYDLRPTLYYSLAYLGPLNATYTALPPR